MSQFSEGPIALLEVSDVTGQRAVDIEEVDGDATVGELVDRLLADLELTRDDADGRPITYRARLEREGRHLHAAERVADALRTGDRLVLQPNIDAGGPADRR
ncbi:MAG: hypothetical protein AB7R55_07295 [Gemmatimonadales bacterium]